MNNQKDNNYNSSVNKAISPFSNKNVSNYHNVFEHSVYVELAERSAKLVTALYMISDFLDTNDPLRSLLRETVTDAMGKLFSLTHARNQQRVEVLSEVNNLFYATANYLLIIYRNGKVSQMNQTVITEELERLRNHITNQITKSLPYDNKVSRTASVEQFTFQQDFFNKDDAGTLSAYQKDRLNNTEYVKDKSSETNSVKKTLNEEPVFVAKKTPTKRMHTDYFVKPKKTKKKAVRTPKVNEAKEERKENILKILKQKKDASITDICTLFKNCSSKTIQRDLNELIKDKLVRKEGSRRWSTYNLNY